MSEAVSTTPEPACRCVIGLDISLTGTGIACIDLLTGELTTAVHGSAAPADSDNVAAHVLRHRNLTDGIVRQVVACNPALVAIEGLKFNARSKDSSLTRRGFLWWAVAEGLVAAGVPILEVGQSQIKQIATGKGNCSKVEVAAAYAAAWPHAARGGQLTDRADASFAASLAAAFLGFGHVLPFKMTAAQRKPVGRLSQPSAPVRRLCVELAA